jgi:Ca2+-binding RTX toxin-like protein
MAGKKTVTASTNDLIKGLKRTTQWDSTTLSTYIADSGDAARISAVYLDRIGSAPAGTYDPFTVGDAAEAPWLLAIARAQTAFSLVSNITFTTETDINKADIVWSGGYDSLGGRAIARMDAPGEKLKPGSTTDYQSFFLTIMNNATYDEAGETGGGSFSDFVILHEFGHGLGLSHPHNDDRGSTKWTDGARIATDNKADNARYTVMSYEIGGLDTLVIGKFGNSVTPAALDIAAMQEIYGARAAYTGDTVYTLTDQGTTALDLAGADGSISIGRAFYTIWDTGGSDEISYTGAKNAYINLNDATLVQTATPEDKEILDDIRRTDAFAQMTVNHGSGGTSQPKNELTDPAYHAGGYFSTLSGAGGTQMGGYSIASGVVIENATSGSGKDILIGNAAANTLSSGAGNDLVAGGAGNDTLDAGAGDDELIGGAGNDALDGGAGTDTAFFSGPCASYSIDKDMATGSVTVSHVDGGRDGVDVLSNVEFAKFSDATIDLTAEEITACPPLDFIFLVDLSGSFSDDLASFRTSAREIVADLRDDNADVRFALASFIDRPVSPFGSAGDYLYRPELALTDSITDFEAVLAGLSTGFGGDLPEAQWVAMWRAANGIGLNLREDSSRVIYLATDAPAHTASDYGLNEATIRNFLETEGIDTIGGGLAAAAGGLAGGTSGLADWDGIGVPPTETVVRDPTDPGYDTGTASTDRAADPLLVEIGRVLSAMDATPIIGTTRFGGGAGYEAILGAVGSSGVVLETDSAGATASDAIRAGLAAIRGSVSEIGTSGNDTLTGTEGNDVILGLGGNDSITGLEGDDELDGGAGSDTIEGGIGDDELAGGTGNDSLDGGDGDDNLRPGSGVDTITSGAGFDIIAGAPNALNGDRIEDLTAQDAIFINTFEPGTTPPALIQASFGVADTRLSTDTTGDGVNDLQIIAAGDVTGLGLELYQSGVDAVIAVRNFLGTTGADVLRANPANNNLTGLAGDDLMLGAGGSDFLTPGSGNDTIDGGAGSDMVSFFDYAQAVIVDLGLGTARSGPDTNVLIGVENVTGSVFGDFIAGDANDNRIRGLGDYDWMIGSGGRDQYDGGTGRDMISYVNAESRVVVDLAGGRGREGQAMNDTYVSVERVTGSIYADHMTGDDNPNDFRGLGGYDWFVGSGGGKDRYDGGSGIDAVAYSASGSGVIASLLLGRGSAGDAARDLYTSIENLTGSSFDDILTGDHGRNTLRGLYGEDRLFGNGGVDYMTGGGSDDYLDGGSGWDVAIFSGNRAEYTVSTSAGITIVDRIASGGDGTDTLVNMEAMSFADEFILL